MLFLSCFVVVYSVDIRVKIIIAYFICSRNKIMMAGQYLPHYFFYVWLKKMAAAVLRGAETA